MYYTAWYQLYSFIQCKARRERTGTSERLQHLQAALSVLSAKFGLHLPPLPHHALLPYLPEDLVLDDPLGRRPTCKIRAPKSLGRSRPILALEGSASPFPTLFSFNPCLFKYTFCLLHSMATRLSRARCLPLSPSISVCSSSLCRVGPVAGTLSSRFMSPSSPFSCNCLHRLWTL